MSDGLRGDPWWASGPVDGLDGDEDPFDRHTSARRGEGDTAGGMPHAHVGGPGEVCHACPVCIALRAFGQSRPELISHLSEAMRHLSLAARAFIEAQADATGGADGGLQRVDLEDE